MDVWQQLTSQSGKYLALALCLALALAGGEAAAQGKKKVAAPWVGKTAEGKPCKGGQPTTGPFDYLRRRQLVGELQVVEEYHFDSNVENLIKGLSTEPMGDIDFTLRAFPNHHRALNSAVKFRLRHKRWPERSKGVRAECYLQRAINFSPRDPIPYSLLGYTLHKLGKPNRAIDPYKTAVEMSPGDMMLKYNLALALTDLERYPQARRYAEEVYAAGFPLPALKKRLLEAGHWEGATVAPKGSQTKKAPKQQGNKAHVARANAKQNAAEGEAAGLSKKEQFAAAIAAMQAGEAESKGAVSNGASGESTDIPRQSTDKTEALTTATVAQEATPAEEQQAESGDKAPGEPKKFPTKADGTPLTKEEQAAIIAAALKKKGQQSSARKKPLTKKEQYAAALAAQAKKEAGAAPTLSDVDPETRKEQFAAKLAAKGLLESEEGAETESAGEETAAEEELQQESGDQTP